MRGEQRRRVVCRSALGLGLAALAVFAVLPSAAAKAPEPKNATTSVVENKHATGIDLSTVPKIKKYLRSLGVSTKGIVVQRGARNYAGPNCPSIAWNCTAARGVVVQLTEDGENTFECSPSSDTGPSSCEVFQTTTDGSNHATCRESSGANPVTLTCDVTQANVNGDNHVTIDQNVDQRGGATQTATVLADLNQDNVSGDNHASLSQSISQFTSDVASLMQSQDAVFSADVFQDTDSGGNNFLQQGQRLHQSGRASGSSSVLQMQTADHFGQVDQEVGEDIGEGFTVFAVGMLQADGEEGFSKAHAVQFERQSLKGPGEQIQIGPMNCCGAGSQAGSLEQTLFTIEQDSAQNASQGGAEQESDLFGSCFSTGTCSIHHNARNDEDRITVHESVDGTPLFVTTNCESTEAGEGEGSGMCFSSTDVGGGD